LGAVASGAVGCASCAPLPAIAVVELVRKMRTLHAAHRRITDARARMPAQWRIPDGQAEALKGNSTHCGHSLQAGHRPV